MSEQLPSDDATDELVVAAQSEFDDGNTAELLDGVVEDPAVSFDEIENEDFHLDQREEEALALDNLSKLSTQMTAQSDGLNVAEGSPVASRQDKTEAQTGEQSIPNAGKDEQYGTHFLILTSSGKPVYTSVGDADALAGLMALVTALVSVVQSHGDQISHVIRGRQQIVLLSKGPLILLAACKYGQALEVLQTQLHLLHRQILLIVTKGVERILLRNPAYDVRMLLEGVGTVLDNLLTRLTHDASYLLPGTQPLALPAADQAVTSQAVAAAVKASGAYYGLLAVSGGYVVSQCHDIGTTHPGTGKPLTSQEPADILLLDNFIACNANMRLQHGEAFCPLCLPGYSPSTFLHAYVHFLIPATPRSTTKQSGSAAEAPDGDQEDCEGIVSAHTMNGPSHPGLYLVLMCPTSDTFHACSQARHTLESVLESSGLLTRLSLLIQGGGVRSPLEVPHPRDRDTTHLGQHQGQGMSRVLAGNAGHAWLSVRRIPMIAGGGSFGCTPLWHFMARYVQRRQVVCAQYDAPFSSPAARHDLAVSYGRLFSIARDRTDGHRPHKMTWIATEKYILMAVIDAQLELAVVLDPLVDKDTGSRCCEQLKRYLLGKAVVQDLLRT